MADITMCRGDGCPKAENCYRYNAQPNEFHQSYFMLVPIEEDGTCEYFWDDEDHGP